MPFRTGKYTETCVVCKKPTSLRCARCDAPTCFAHRAERTGRCDDCETRYADAIEAENWRRRR